MLIHREVGVQNVVLRADTEVLADLWHLFVDVHAYKGCARTNGLVEVSRGIIYIFGVHWCVWSVGGCCCLPSMMADPAVGGNKPVSIPIAVVFPAPLCPSKAVIWPEYMVRFRPSTAVFTPVGV